MYRFVVGCLCLAGICAGVSAQGPDDIADPLALWEQATIYRDEWGTPHVYAEDPRGLAFAFGYAQAEDQIETLLRAYRVASGRAAEVYGEAYAKSDEHAITMGFATLAQSVFPYADPLTRQLCEGFATGVNTWIVDHPDRVPEWTEGVRPEDPLTLLHAYLMSFAPFDLPGKPHPGPAASTGNAWAVAPSRSATGETILVINPHTSYEGAYQWYEAHLAMGDYNVAGATLVGLPLIMQGHNDVLGWALTPNWPDFADMYAEVNAQATFDPKSVMQPTITPEMLRFLELMASTRSYYVKTPGGLEERVVTYYATERGPVVGEYEDRFVTYRIGGYHDFGALRQLYQMGSAASLYQFQSALELHQIPCFHITYADREGNLFYLYNAKVGEKYEPPPPLEDPETGEPIPVPGPAPADWSMPVDGGMTAYAWGEIVPPELLPSVTNPASGFIQACGNPPWTVTKNTDLDPNLWPGWFVHDRDTYRAKRVRQLLGTGPRSFEDAQFMLYDMLVPFAVTAVPQLVESADANPDWIDQAHPDLAPAIEVLRNWNKVASPDSPGMTLFHVWWAAFRARSPGISEPELLDYLIGNSPEVQEYSLRTAEQAARLLRSEFDSVEVPWGDVHVYARGDIEAPAPGATTGEPIFVAGDSKFRDGKWRVTYGSGYAMVVKFGEQPEAVSLVPFGSSSDPDSPHYADQMKLLQKQTFKRTRFIDEDVQRNASRIFGRSLSLFPPGMEAACTLHARRPVSARVDVYTQPPAPLPFGTATFTLYAHVNQQPANVPTSIELEVYIPPEVCPAEHLDGLAFYSYDATNGWQPLEVQEFDAQTRIFTMHDRFPRVYAVLGPQEFRAAPMSAADAAARTLFGPGEDTETGDPETDPVAPPPDTIQPIGEQAMNASQPVEDRAPAPEGSPGGNDSSARHSALAWGNNFDLAPPDAKGLVHVESDKYIGARLAVTSDPTSAPPAGLARFSDVVSLECSDPEAELKVGLSLAPLEGVCPPEYVKHLRIHVYDDANGWQPLPDQQVDEEKGTIAAQDAAARRYALFGPEDYYVAPASPAE